MNRFLRRLSCWIDRLIYFWSLTLMAQRFIVRGFSVDKSKIDALHERLIQHCPSLRAFLIVADFAYKFNGDRFFLGTRPTPQRLQKGVLNS